jgi:hypothetical protein
MMLDPGLLFRCARCNRGGLAVRYGLPGEPRLCAGCWYATHDNWPDARTVPPDPYPGRSWHPEPVRSPRRARLDGDALAQAALEDAERRAHNRPARAPRCTACDRPMTVAQTDTHWSCR